MPYRATSLLQESGKSPGPRLPRAKGTHFQPNATLTTSEDVLGPPRTTYLAVKLALPGVELRSEHLPLLLGAAPAARSQRCAETGCSSAGSCPRSGRLPVRAQGRKQWQTRWWAPLGDAVHDESVGQ